MSQHLANFEYIVRLPPRVSSSNRPHELCHPGKGETLGGKAVKKTEVGKSTRVNGISPICRSACTVKTTTFRDLRDFCPRLTTAFYTPTRSPTADPPRDCGALNGPLTPLLSRSTETSATIFPLRRKDGEPRCPIKIPPPHIRPGPTDASLAASCFLLRFPLDERDEWRRLKSGLALPLPLLFPVESKFWHQVLTPAKHFFIIVSRGINFVEGYIIIL